MKYTEYRILMLRDGEWKPAKMWFSPASLPYCRTKDWCEKLLQSAKDGWAKAEMHHDKKQPEAWKIQRRTVEVKETEWEEDD